MQKQEVVVIPIPDSVLVKMHVLVGSPHALFNIPKEIFDSTCVRFLAQLSRRLLADPRARALPDVTTFAYWCRQANLSRMAAAVNIAGGLRMGLGLTYHICPANVPVNFAFSMAFGLLSGNSNVLRLPSKSSPAAELLLEAIKRELEDPAHGHVRQALLLVRFERDDDVNRFWMSVADGRIVWGGDATVAHMRSFSTKPRSREVAFADRYSICVLEPNSILAMDEPALRVFCQRLFNDIYLMDQAACSSPQLCVWIGSQEAVALAQTRLWPALTDHAQHHYELQPVQIMDKFVQICQHALNQTEAYQIVRHQNILYRVELASAGPRQDDYRGYFGTVHEVVFETLEQLAPLVNERYQTLCIQGVAPDAVRKLIVRHGLRGIDRVVPVGRALDMDIVWDGYDLIGSLTRLITF
jgi:Acyl-CoA reductase (LuxC)